ncbi:MAG: succinate dehydrogenase cytochrome b subunit [Saprospiraceae bacterium]|nr:succinate dehydrogenase cytochrome b subunit [Saprospiraceae bacterium]MDW8229316.1 succinate dehydrogenase cytochrome b subunit [Saprospiraceae bacterium]
MSWFTRFITSSIGQKFVMALTGLFLILFLFVHLAGNLQLLKQDGGEAFNTYAHFMTTNPLIKTISYLLYTSILLHSVQGLLLWRYNRAARGQQRYAVSYTRPEERPARSMAWVGIIIFVFILIHLYQFWFQMHWGELEMKTYAGYPHEVKDLYSLVSATYQDPFFVIFYAACMVVVGIHLWHGFWSAFHTLGLGHRKYVPAVRFIGMAYAVIIPLLFAIIPVVMYLRG